MTPLLSAAVTIVEEASFWISTTLCDQGVYDEGYDGITGQVKARKISSRTGWRDVSVCHRLQKAWMREHTRHFSSIGIGHWHRHRCSVWSRLSHATGSGSEYSKEKNSLLHFVVQAERLSFKLLLNRCRNGKTFRCPRKRQKCEEESMRSQDRQCVEIKAMNIECNLGRFAGG